MSYTRVLLDETRPYDHKAMTAAMKRTAAILTGSKALPDFRDADEAAEFMKRTAEIDEGAVKAIPDPEVLSEQGKPPRKPAMATTQMTLKHYRDRGYECAVTEHFNAYAGVRNDLFGFCDVLAVGNGEIVMVQTTSWDNVGARRTKIRGIRVVGKLLAVPNLRIEIQGWRKRDGRWENKTEEYKP